MPEFTAEDAIRGRYDPKLVDRVMRVGRVLQRYGLPIFLAAVVGAILLVWVHALLFSYVDTIAAAQTAEAVEVTNRFGGALTITEIQSYLATGVAAPEVEGWGSPLAYPLWPLQFTLLRDLLAVGALLGFVNVVAIFAIWWERKVSGHIQSRLGPMRVGGWHGWAQGFADGIKLIQKEDTTPGGADWLLFKLAPYLAFVPVFAAFIALPFAEGWVTREMDVALIFILALVGIDVVGVLIGGWASNNKWSVFGAMREACQMVSYEIPMGIALLVPVMTAGTLNLGVIGGEIQSGGFHTWLAFTNPFTFVAAGVYFIASLASVKRAPFDLPEAESELVAGYHTEYSGFRWALFFFGEYAAMYVVSALAVLLFFGGWHSPLPAHWGAAWENGEWWQRGLHGLAFSGPLWFIGKSFFLIYVQIWLRWTLPRMRIDQAMYACVQVMLPMIMLVLLGNTIWQLVIPPYGILAAVGNVILTLIGAVLLVGFMAIALYGHMNRRRLVGSLGMDILPGS